MAFPTTGLLDNFNRSNESPLGNGDWTGPLWSGDPEMELNSNQAQAESAFGNSYWSAATFGADVEVFVTWATVSSGIQLYLRVASPGTSGIDGYYVEANSGDGDYKIVRVDNESETQLGSVISGSFSNGDRLGAEMISDTITAYLDTGGGFSSAGSRTDSTYSAAGNIAILGYATGDVVDDFSGGTVVVGGGGGLPVLWHHHRQQKN